MAVDTTRLARVRVMELLGEEIGEVVEQLYATVASRPDEGFHFPVGARAARLAGYPKAAIAAIPDDVVARFAGVACPLAHVDLAEGQAVLDVGSGAGLDVFLAAHRVGPTGRVVGVDLTEDMVAVATAALDEAGLEHASVVQARAPQLDVEGPFDVVTSNGVLNLVPDKEAVLERLHELLRPGGRLVLSDVALSRPPSTACLSDAELWAECLVGAFTEEAYLEALEAAGFEDVRVEARHDYFQHSDSAKTRATAEDLGAFAWVLTAMKPAT